MTASARRKRRLVYQDLCPVRGGVKTFGSRFLPRPDSHSAPSGLSGTGLVPVWVLPYERVRGCLVLEAVVTDWSLSVIQNAVWGVGYCVGLRDGREVNNASDCGDRRGRLLPAMRRPGGATLARGSRSGGGGAGDRSVGSSYYRRRCASRFAGRFSGGCGATVAAAGTHTAGRMLPWGPGGTYASWAQSAQCLEAEGATDAT
jgi:hypothetical protein